MYKLARAFLKELQEINQSLKVIAYPEKSMMMKQIEEMREKKKLKKNNQTK
ncbi:hypothetical protein I6N96_01185 [Enterococcus sp. BWM-S5]|uniref:Uncharacterized protein n=1 Tax=Enterococcus larvae TaxID=2794352 RepID=A0ABS4CFV0_9ENTE|nr:hypothetical protein [Enterococcus larvae]MBP1044875.1 hypothetical protein [Enterococcus larvae]